MISPDMRLRGRLLRPITQVTNVREFRFFQKGYQALFSRWQPQDPTIRHERVTIYGREGNAIAANVYRPAALPADQQVTGLLWLHGGGYVNGVPEQELPMIEQFMQTRPTVVVSPDYRLSLEAPFPAALNDAYDTLVWLATHASRLQVDPHQIFVGGESAGGGLACCVAAYARDFHGVPIAYQMPLYPMLDDRMTSASMQDNHGPLWNVTSNETAWRLYLGDAFGTATVSPYAAPVRLTHFQGLPPFYSFIGTLDPFYDEAQAYVAALQQAGVSARLATYSGAFHAFDIVVPRAAQSITARERLMAAYQQAVDRYRTV